MPVENVSAWAKRKEHDVTLASGTEVTIKIPNLPALIKSGQIPNHLLDEAIKAADGKTVSANQIGEQNDFTRKIVTITVVQPELAEEQVDDLPFEDIEMLVQFATRQRDVDALGRHIGGLHRSDEWRRFRGFDGSDSIMESE